MKDESYRARRRALKILDSEMFNIHLKELIAKKFSLPFFVPLKSFMNPQAMVFHWNQNGDVIQLLFEV